MKTERKYGSLPVDLGLVEIAPVEMMFWLYCPIKLPEDDFFYLPPNLGQYESLVLAVMKDALSLRRWCGQYAYITAKTLWATPDNPGNRPGWHSDGFLTDDLNYIWSDANPTVFFHDWRKHSFSADHVASLSEMDNLCESRISAQHTFPSKHLLRLDETVLHKVATNITPGVRTFVKVSLSNHKYALIGNSINHRLKFEAEYRDRAPDRNCPIGQDHGK